MGRPATPMYPASEVSDGALSLDDAAAFLGLSKSMIEKLIRGGELLAVYEGRKPRVLKQHLKDRLAAQLAQARAKQGC